MSESQSNVRSAKKRTKNPTPAAGEVWAVPVPQMGYAPLVVAREAPPKSETGFAFGYLRPVLCPEPPSPESIPPLTEWTSAWIGLVPTLPFRKGRWVRCGALAAFDRDAWPVPPTRSSAVDESEPVETWGSHPWGELWSIETTPDEPTMTVIDNAPATREEALRFPVLDVVTRASSFEKALVHHFKNRRPGFWDMHLTFNPVRPDLPALWQNHAAPIRARWPGIPKSWLPAGRTTDRNLRAGMWLAFPVTGGGFGAAMLVSKPPRQFRVFADAVVMAMRPIWNRWPTLDEVRALTPEDGAIIAQTSMICVRDGRWRVLGDHPGFDPDAWVWPIPWWQTIDQKATGVVSVEVERGRVVQIRIGPDLIAMDPHAGTRCRGSSAYSKIELDVRRLADGTAPYRDDDSSPPFEAVVTPERLAAWRAINAAIERAVGRRLR